MIIVYYSRRSPFPALLASIKHCRSALSPEQAWPVAESWIKVNLHPGERPFFLKPFGETSEGDTLYLMTATVPPPVLKRTLNGLSELIRINCHVLLAVYPLSWSRRWEQNCSARRKIACWMEIEALVERTRLQVEFIKQR